MGITDNDSETAAGKLSPQRFRHPNEPQAYPGDTYLADLKEANKAGKPWAKPLIAALILGFLSDLYFLRTTVNVAFDIANTVSNPLFLRSPVIAAALVLLYLFLGYVFGKKLREFRTFRAWSSLASALVSLIILVVAVCFLTVFRLSSGTFLSIGQVAISLFSLLSDSSQQNIQIVAEVSVMTLVMVLTAFISAVYAYYSGDSVSERIYQRSKAALPADKVLYDKTFSACLDDAQKERDYASREQELDSRAVASIFALSNLAAQLNGVVDPADVHDFIDTQPSAIGSYYQE